MNDSVDMKNEEDSGTMRKSPFDAAQIEMLKEPLDKRRVSKRSGGGGMQVSYLKGYDVIATANRIFGFGKWGFAIKQVELVNLPGDNGEIVASYYAASVTLTVAGCVPITEEGVCAVSEGKTPRAKIDGHDTARKGVRCFTHN